MGSLGTLPLVAIFAASAAVIWVAGVTLSTATEAIDTRLKLGSAIGGLLLLSIATNLPELAITIAAAVKGNLDIAVGNILGGIAIQTVVLAGLDAASGEERPLTFLVGSLLLVLEGVLVVVVLVAAMMATQLPVTTNVAGVSPGTVVVVAFWLGGLWIVYKARNGVPWHIEAEGARPGRTHAQRRQSVPKPHRNHTFAHVLLVFTAAALATLVAGFTIEQSGDVLAGRVGLSGAVFGATLLAGATALPQLSSGIQAVKVGDYRLAMSDIFGGNAVLPPMLIFADLIAGSPALPAAHRTDIWIAGLGIVLTGVYIVGIIMRPQAKRWRMGPDSLAAIALYAVGIGGLLLVH
ncbi:MAG: cation:H+ antiporter [Thermoleophilaceae bacterium]|nr:cation:H+ antiporter [Thermoleophilaceae bacterium]